MSDELICCRHPSVLAGGCYSGQVSWWDLRTGTSPTTVSASSAHTDPVYCLVWTSSKAGTEVGWLLILSWLLWSVLWWLLLWLLSWLFCVLW